MDIYRICRTCLNESSSNFVSIYSNLKSNNHNSPIEKDTQITNALDELTCDKYNTNEFPYPDKICEPCLNDLRIAFDFNQRCTKAFEQLVKISENKQFTEHAIEFKSVDEIKSVVEIDTSITSKLVEENEIPDIESIDAKRNKIEENDTMEELNTKSFQCDICKRSFNRSTHLRRHMTIHSDVRAFSCQVCDKKFRRADHLKVHENYHAQIKPHTCQQCQKTFSRAEHLRRHTASQHTQKVVVLICAECGYEGSSTRDLANHRKTHNTPSFVCKFCDQKYSTKAELNEHSKCHIDERPFLCSECGMRFIRNDYLVIHMRRHNGEKPYECRYCGRGFPRSTDLSVHERYHTNEKKHVCSVCGKSFHRA